MGNRLTTVAQTDPKVNFILWIAHNYWSGVLHRVDRASSPRTRPNDHCTESPSRSPCVSPDLRQVSRGPPDGNSSQSECEECDRLDVINLPDAEQAEEDCDCCCSCCETESDSDSSCVDGCCGDNMKSDISRFDDSGGIRIRSVSPLNRSRHERRPPVYSVEDYATFLHRLSKLSPSQLYLVLDNNKNINETKESKKNNENKEMVSRQPASVSELLQKLKMDLKSAYSSFAKEFVSYPFDGASVLLDILRLIQLSQVEVTGMPKPAVRRENHTKMRRAVSDEQSCLMCLQHCLMLDAEEAPRRLVDHDNGLYTVAVCLLSHVNKSRILALELLARSSAVQPNGHSRVSDALSALRLRFGEPVRLKFLVGMMKSGKGELLLAGMKFFNALIVNAPSIRDKVYLQKEIEDAGFNPDTLDKCDDDETEILLRKELALWRDAVVDVDAMAERLGLIAGTNAAMKKDLDDLRSRMAKLEDEKSIFSTVEASLRQRIHELETENSRLRAQVNFPPQPAYDSPAGSTIIKLTTDNDTLHHEITSSTSVSSLSDGFEKLSPLPPNLSLTRDSYRESIRGDDIIYVEPEYGQRYESIDRKTGYGEHIYDATNSSLIIPTDVRTHVDEDATIDEVLQELSNIVHDEERSDQESCLQSKSHFEDRASPDRISDELKIVPKRYPSPPKRNSDFLKLDVNLDSETNDTDIDSADDVMYDKPKFKSSFGRKISENYGVSPFTARYKTGESESKSSNGPWYSGDSTRQSSDDAWYSGDIPRKTIDTRKSGDGAAGGDWPESGLGSYHRKKKNTSDVSLHRNESFRYRNYSEYKGRSSAEGFHTPEESPVKQYRRRTQVINYDFDGRTEESRRRTRSFESLLVQAMPFYNDVPSYENTAGPGALHFPNNVRRIEGTKYQEAKSRIGFLKNKIDEYKPVYPQEGDTNLPTSEFSTDKFRRRKNPRLCETASGLY